MIAQVAAAEGAAVNITVAAGSGVRGVPATPEALPGLVVTEPKVLHQRLRV